MPDTVSGLLGAVSGLPDAGTISGERGAVSGLPGTVSSLPGSVSGLPGAGTVSGLPGAVSGQPGASLWKCASTNSAKALPIPTDGSELNDNLSPPNLMVGLGPSVDSVQHYVGSKMMFLGPTLRQDYPLSPILVETLCAFTVGNYWMCKLKTCSHAKDA